jgi:hypothetical protein
VITVNPLDRLLQDEVSRLLDRIAATLPAGTLAESSAAHPQLRARLDETDARLGALRASMLETYAAWGRTLEDLDNLWALAAWRKEQDGAIAA